MNTAKPSLTNSPDKLTPFELELLNKKLAIAIKSKEHELQAINLSVFGIQNPDDINIKPKTNDEKLVQLRAMSLEKQNQAKHDFENAKREIKVVKDVG